MKSTLFVFALVLLTIPAGVFSQVAVRGAYGYVPGFWQAGHSLTDHGVNAIFVYHHAFSDSMIQTARQQGLRVFAEFATLNGKSYLKSHPDAWPIDAEGNRVPQASWFMGICPTHPGFREYRLNQLAAFLDRYRVDGIWMDYLHWHAQFEDPDPILPETCFCDRCVHQFERDTGISVRADSTAARARILLSEYEKEWRDWRCSVIESWVHSIRKSVDEHQPGILLGCFHAPWTDEDHNGARRRILGLDLKALAADVDVFSPMVYHARMGQSPEWVGSTVSWLCSYLNTSSDTTERVWPIIQAHDDPEPISAETFERVLRAGTTSCADGIMMFSIQSLIHDPVKRRVLKSVYTSWK
jgi:hypothetical protein